jgi:hypothetical protein
MTKSKKFWAAMAVLSLAVMVFAAWSMYGRIAQHFSGDTIEVRPVPMPPPSEDEAGAQVQDSPVEKAEKEEKADQEEEAKAGKPAAAPAAAPAKAEGEKVKAVRTPFEYKDPAAKSVRIAGTFTSWKEKALAKKDGVWKTEVYILPGTYPYHFIVNGKNKADPGKPKTPGGDSLVTVP